MAVWNSVGWSKKQCKKLRWYKTPFYHTLLIRLSYINTTHGQFFLWKLLYLKEKGNHHWQAILRATNKKLVLSFRVFLRMFWSVFGDVAHDRSQNPYLSAPRNTSYSLPLPVRNKCPTKFQGNKCECCCHQHVWKTAASPWIENAQGQVL